MHFLNGVGRWLRRKPSHKLFTVLFLGGMILVLLFTLASFAFVSAVDLLDGDDLPFFEIANFSHMPESGLVVVLAVGIELGVLLTILRLQYLKSHIGEKVFALFLAGSGMFALHKLISVAAQLSSCAVTFLFSVRTFVVRTAWVASSFEIVPISWREFSSISLEVYICRGWVSFVYRKK